MSAQPSYLDQEKFSSAMLKYREQEWSDAASEFSELLQERSEKYGETSYQSAEVAYYYGVSMFELGKQLAQNEILGAGVKKLSDSAAEQIVQEEQKAAAASAGVGAGKKPRGGAASAASKRKQIISVEEEEESDDDDEEGEGKDGEDSDDDDEEKETAEECFSTAFSVLEIARQGYLSQLPKTVSPKEYYSVEKKIIDTLLTMADIDMENDQFADARKSYEQALELLQMREEAFIDRNDRHTMAEIYMQMGMCYDQESAFSKSQDMYEKSAVILRKLKSDYEEKFNDVTAAVSDLEQKAEESKAAAQEQPVSVAASSASSAASASAAPAASTAATAGQTVNILQPRRKRQREDEASQQNGASASATENGVKKQKKDE